MVFALVKSDIVCQSDMCLSFHFPDTEWRGYKFFKQAFALSLIKIAIFLLIGRSDPIYHPNNAHKVGTQLLPQTQVFLLIVLGKIKIKAGRSTTGARVFR